jgi:uncharacterized protein
MMQVPLLKPEFKATLAESDAPELFAELRLQGPLTCDLTVEEDKLEHSFWVRGTVRGAQELLCVRSLEPFVRPFETALEVLVKRSPSAHEQRDDDGEDELYEISLPQHLTDVDLTDAVRQMVVLQEPMNPVKNPEEEFVWLPQTQVADEDSIDPRWAALQELRKRMNG